MYARQNAVHNAIEIAKITGITDVLGLAKEVLAFITAAPDLEPEASIAGLSLDAVSNKEAEPVKKSRKPRAAAATVVTETATAKAAEPDVGTTDAALADTGQGDLFDDEPVNDEPVKEITVDDVRAKLVMVQTKFKSADHARGLLKKFSTTGTLGGLKKEDHAKLAALCDNELAK
jgi:hypothetical protein